MTVQSPLEMAKWLARKDEVLRLRSEARKAAGKLREARAMAESALALLKKAAQMLGLEHPTQELVDLDRQLRQALSKMHVAATEKLAAMTKVKAAREAFQKTKNAFERAATADAKWLAAWQSALVEIHIAPTAGTAEAEAALDAWEAVATPLTKRKEDQRRHEGLNEDLEHFRADVSSNRCRTRRRRSRSARLSRRSSATSRRSSIPRKARLKTTPPFKAAFRTSGRSWTKLENSTGSATFVIDGLRRTYGFEPDVDAYDLARRSLQRRSLGNQIEERAKELAKAGDGLDEATLQAEVNSVPPDQANAELAAIQEEEGLLIAKIQLLAKAETEADHALAALGGKKGAAVADQEARNAALAAGGHIERWLRLEVARQLLERSVRRYQDENQDPMITRASDLFARIARTAANPIERISIDYRNASKPVPIGRRHDGSECGLEGLSEATSDQLFLSLRVAAIERFCQDNEPMPFIADDLFVSSDEQRVLPLLQILAELGRTTQVIAFTHHRHVVDIAKSLLAAGVRIHTMPETA